MDIGEDVVPVFARLRNSVRVVEEKVLEGESKLRYIVEVILGEFGHVGKKEVLAIQDYPRRGVYDVTFNGEGIFSSFLKILEENREDIRLHGYRIFPHVSQEEIILVIKSYSPFVSMREVETVLKQYCDKLTLTGKILSEVGIWTSKLKYKAKFKKGMLPPARFKLGGINLDCHFAGMPVFCRRCRSYGHTAEKCKICSNCGESSHELKDCVHPKRCNLCFQFGHLYARCPQRGKAASQGKALPEEPVVTPSVETQVESVSKEVEDPGQLQDLTEDFGVSGLEAISLQVQSLVHLSEPQQMEVTTKEDKVSVKRKKKKEEGTSFGNVSPVSPVSPAGKQKRSSTRGENLYRYWKDRTTKEIQEYIRTWTDEEEIIGIKKCLPDSHDGKDLRQRVLEYFRTLK